MLNLFKLIKTINNTDTLTLFIDNNGRVLFEGKFGECEQFMKKNNLKDKKDVKLEPFHTEVK